MSQKKGRPETRRYPQMPGRTPVEEMRSEKKGSFHKVLGKPHEIQYLPKVILKQSEPTKHLGKKEGSWRTWKFGIQFILTQGNQLRPSGMLPWSAAI